MALELNYYQKSELLSDLLIVGSYMNKGKGTQLYKIVLLGGAKVELLPKLIYMTRRATRRTNNIILGLYR